MAELGRRGSIWAAPAWRFRLGLLLAVAFAPVLIDLAAHLVEHPWARVCLVFPWLVYRASRATAAREARPAWAWAFLLIGVASELLALGGGALRIARLGAALSIAGMLWAAGWARIGVALLVFACVPVPSQLLGRVSPGLESLLGGIVALAPGVTLASTAAGVTLEAGGSGLVLLPPDGGLPLMIAMAGIGWFLAARRMAAVTELIATAVCGGLVGLVLQGFVLLLGLGLAVAGEERLARSWLDQAGWLIVSGLGVAAATRFEGCSPLAGGWTRPADPIAAKGGR